MNLTINNYKKYLKYKIKYYQLKNINGGSTTIHDKFKQNFKHRIGLLLGKLGITDSNKQNEIINKIVSKLEPLDSEANYDNLLQDLDDATKQLSIADENLKSFFENNKKYVNPTIWNDTREQIGELQGLVLLQKIKQIENTTVEDKCKKVTTALLTAINKKTDVVNNILVNNLH